MAASGLFSLRRFNMQCGTRLISGSCVPECTRVPPDGGRWRAARGAGPRRNVALFSRCSSIINTHSPLHCTARMSRLQRLIFTHRLHVSAMALPQSPPFTYLCISPFIFFYSEGNGNEEQEMALGRSRHVQRQPRAILLNISAPPRPRLIRLWWRSS